MTWINSTIVVWWNHQSRISSIFCFKNTPATLRKRAPMMGTETFFNIRKFCQKCCYLSGFNLVSVSNFRCSLRLLRSSPTGEGWRRGFDEGGGCVLIFPNKDWLLSQVPFRHNCPDPCIFQNTRVQPENSKLRSILERFREVKARNMSVRLYQRESFWTKNQLSPKRTNENVWTK